MLVTRILSSCVTLNNVSLSYQMVPGTLDPFPKFNGSDVASMTASVIFCHSASRLSERISLLIWLSCLNVRPTCGSEHCRRRRERSARHRLLEGQQSGSPVINITY